MNEVKIITAVETELISTATAKSYLKVDHVDENELIDDLIKASREQIEKWCGVSIGEQERQWIVDIEEETEIPYGPIVISEEDELTASLKDSDGYEEMTIDDDYELESDAQFVTFTPGTSGRWKLEYTCGYTTDTLPPGLKIIWLQLIAFLYLNRGNEGVEMPSQIKYALNPYKRSLI